MTDEFAATAVAEHVLCPRRAYLRSGGPAHLETSVFSAIVRRGLQRAAESRIAKEPYDLGFVMHELLRAQGLEDDRELFERARNLTRVGLQTLHDYRPSIAEATFGTTIAGVRIGGTVDLIAEGADGAIFVWAFRTGQVPVSTLEIQLSLASRGIANTYASATYVVLDLFENRAVRRVATLLDDESLDVYLREALENERDEPRPGPYCGSCDFLARCPEGRALYDFKGSESAVIVSSVPIARDAYEAYLIACGAERLSDEEYVLMTDGGSIWISHAASYLDYITGVTEGMLDEKLGADPAFCCDVTITKDPGSDQVAMTFAIAFLERWPGVVYDYGAMTFELEDLRARAANGAYVWKPEPNA